MSSKKNRHEKTNKIVEQKAKSVEVQNTATPATQSDNKKQGNGALDVFLWLVIVIAIAAAGVTWRITTRNLAY